LARLLEAVDRGFPVPEAVVATPQASSSGSHVSFPLSVWQLSIGAVHLPCIQLPCQRELLSRPNMALSRFTQNHSLQPGSDQNQTPDQRSPWASFWAGLGPPQLSEGPFPASGQLAHFVYRVGFAPLKQLPAHLGPQVCHLPPLNPTLYPVVAQLEPGSSPCTCHHL
jgi:hypothetical protein